MPTNFHDTDTIYALTTVIDGNSSVNLPVPVHRHECSDDEWRFLAEAARVHAWFADFVRKLGGKPPDDKPTLSLCDECGRWWAIQTREDEGSMTFDRCLVCGALSSTDLEATS